MLSVRDSKASILSSLAIAKANTKYPLLPGAGKPSGQGRQKRLGGLHHGKCDFPVPTPSKIKWPLTKEVRLPIPHSSLPHPSGRGVVSAPPPRNNWQEVMQTITRPVSRRRCKATEASALSFMARLSFLPERERSSGTESRKASRRAASASINCSTGPPGSLANYFLSILMTFPSANSASRAAWRARRLALLTLSSSVLATVWIRSCSSSKGSLKIHLQRQVSEKKILRNFVAFL